MDNAPGSVPQDTHVEEEKVSRSDREVLRRLAGRVAELAARPIEREKQKLWTLHNDLKPTRPLVFCDPENGWAEIIRESDLETTGELARQWEYGLRKGIFWATSMCDDRVTEPCFNVGYVHTRSDWGLVEKYTRVQADGAYVWDAPIKNLDDLAGLHYQKITVDYPATERQMAIAKDVFDDILPVRLRMSWFWTLGMTWELVKLRGLEQIMLDMYDNPKGLHNLMAFIRDSTMATVDFLEREGLFSLNNEGDYVGSGGFGWTTQLPAKGFKGKVRTRDLWCLSESQETVGVSPDMFEEFIFAYQLPLVERFGLVCYGCCEPVHTRWNVIRRIPNLRRVSVSPWCDREKMAEYLGGDYIFSLKPHPGLLAAERFDPDAVRADIQDALDKTKGCHLEVIMKDNHTIRNDPSRATNWVKIVREEIDERFGG